MLHLRRQEDWEALTPSEAGTGLREQACVPRRTKLVDNLPEDREEREGVQNLAVPVYMKASVAIAVGSERETHSWETCSKWQKRLTDGYQTRHIW